MVVKSLTGKLDKDFVTIYFMQGEKNDGKISVRRLSLVLSVILILFLAIFFRVWQEMQVMKMGYTINQLRHESDEVLNEHRILLSQRNALASLERIENIATEKLGLVTPKSDQLVFLVDPAESPRKLDSTFLKWFSHILNP